MRITRSNQQLVNLDLLNQNSKSLSRLLKVQFFIQKNEAWFFYIIGLLCFLPIFQNKIFIALDMPAHIYNANLLNHLLFENKDIVSQYVHINADLVPNYSGHVIIVALLKFFTPLNTIKLLLFVYVLVFLIGWRKLLSSISPQTTRWSFIILPLIFNQMIFLGFINFLLAIGFGMWSFAIVLNYLKMQKNSELYKLFFMLIFLWFSHIAVFVTLVFLIMPILCINYKKGSLKKYIKLFIIFLPFILITINYFLQRPAIMILSYNSGEILNLLISAKALIGLGNLEETYAISYIFIIYGFTIFLFSWQLSKNKIKINDLISTVSMILIALVMIFFIPDSDGRGGNMTMRLILLFYVLIVVILCVLLTAFQSIKIILSVYAIILTLVWNIQNQFQIDPLQTYINQVLEAEKHVDPNSIIYVIPKNDHWLFAHASNYLGMNKPVVISENYECRHDYFPIRMNNKDFMRIENRYSKESEKSLIQTIINEKLNLPNYVFLYGENTPILKAELIRNKDLDSYYNLVHSSNFCYLFKIKKL